MTISFHSIGLDHLVEDNKKPDKENGSACHEDFSRWINHGSRGLAAEIGADLRQVSRPGTTNALLRNIAMDLLGSVDASRAP